LAPIKINDPVFNYLSEIAAAPKIYGFFYTHFLLFYVIVYFSHITSFSKVLTRCRAGALKFVTGRLTHVLVPYAVIRNLPELEKLD